MGVQEDQGKVSGLMAKKDKDIEVPEGELTRLFSAGREWQWDDLTDEEKASVLALHDREAKGRKRGKG